MSNQGGARRGLYVIPTLAGIVFYVLHVKVHVFSLHGMLDNTLVIGKVQPMWLVHCLLNETQGGKPDASADQRYPSSDGKAGCLRFAIETKKLDTSSTCSPWKAEMEIWTA